MRIRIAKPLAYFEFHKRQGAEKFFYTDVEKFYDSLPSILDDMNIDYDVLHIREHSRIIHKKKDSIYLAWHNHGTLPNIWHLQAGYMPNYLYFDKNGFGPWSEIVDECNYSVPVEDVREEVDTFCSNYISNNTSTNLSTEEISEILEFNSYNIEEDLLVETLIQETGFTITDEDFEQTDELMEYLVDYDIDYETLVYELYEI